jgi:predicted dehydrogenase
LRKLAEIQTIWCRHFVGDGGGYYFKNYNSEREYTMSLLLQKGAHDLDLIHWFADAHTRSVTGMGKLSVYNRVTDRRAPEVGRLRPKKDRSNWPPLTQTQLSPVIDVEDLNMLLMQLSNGVQASYLECFYTPDYHRNYTVIGTEGRLENYGDHSTSEKWATVHLWNRRCGHSELGHEVFRIPPALGGHGGADPLMIEDFFRFVETGEHLGARPIDARMAVAVGCQGAESIRSGGGVVKIPDWA